MAKTHEGSHLQRRKSTCLTVKMLWSAVKNPNGFSPLIRFCCFADKPWNGRRIFGSSDKNIRWKAWIWKRKVNRLGNHIKSHSQYRRPQPSLQPLIQFDFCLNSISAIKKKEIEWAGGPPGFRTVRTKKLKGCSCEACRPRAVSHLWKAWSYFALNCCGLLYSNRLYIFRKCLLIRLFFWHCSL